MARMSPTAAVPLESEVFMEERVTRLETTAEHIQGDVGELKTDVRRLDTKVDGVKDSIVAVDLKIASLDTKIEKSFAALALQIEKSLGELKTARMADRIWWLAITAGTVSLIARAFKWI